MTTTAWAVCLRAAGSNPGCHIDFGDVFINLEKETSIEEFKKLGLDGPNEDLLAHNDLFEKGKITELQFINSFLKYIPNAGIEEIIKAWNSVIGDFPLYRLEFLQMLSSRYRLFLLTNTDSIHISRFEHKVGMSFYSDFSLPSAANRQV